MKASRLRQIKQESAINQDIAAVFLLNWHYHHQRFRTIAEALDPEINQAVAGQILREQLQRSGSLLQAIARYHSADPLLGQAYLARVLRIARQEQSDMENQDRQAR